MKKLLTFIFVLIFTSNSFSQKMYIWCPDEMEPVEQAEKLNDIKVYLNVEDVRLLSKKKKEKCSSEELISSLEDLITSTYPNAEYVNNEDDGNLIVQVQITAYYAEFHTAVWKGKTEMNVEFIDKRNGSKITEQFEISKSKANANFGGMITAKNNLRKSYNKAMIELFAALNKFVG